jgi:hypothetical protein
MLEATFGRGNPLVFNLPARQTVRPEDVMFDEFTMMFAGATSAMKAGFAGRQDYMAPNGDASLSLGSNGFTVAAAAGDPDWVAFRPTRVIPPADGLPLATDAWPFLYLRRPMIPGLSLRGMALMSALGAIFLVPFWRRPAGTARSVGPANSSSPWLLAQMFCLGAGFMLIETKAVVHMALLFGSTWIVNSIVFCAVLSMILLANLYVLRRMPRSLTPYYVALIASLLLNAAVPLDAFLGLPRVVQILGACVLAFLPVLFAGVIFAVSFARAADAERAFGANIAGAMLGGVSENLSMLVGFQYVILVAVVFYALSWVGARRAVDPRVSPASTA